MSDTIEPQAVCGFTQDDMTDVLADLLPVGAVWPRDPDTAIMRTMAGLAAEFARLLARDCDLLDESYPGTATETITDWERVCGLPDACTGPLDTLEERREAVLSKLASRGGQSRQYFIDGAAMLGFTITITEYRPMLADQCRAEDACYHQSNGRANGIEDPTRDNDWWFVWRVDSVDAVKITYFTASGSNAGEPLARWGNDMLECWILENKPAHTWVLFSYAGGAPQPPGVLEAIWDAGASIWDDGDSIWYEDRP
jgi:uncharacterized protein YmfQ (DUF2313 family)